MIETERKEKNLGRSVLENTSIIINSEDDSESPAEAEFRTKENVKSAQPDLSQEEQEVREREIKLKSQEQKLKKEIIE